MEKRPKNIKKCKIKIINLDSHAIETHFELTTELRKHRLKSSKKRQNASNSKSK